MTFHDSNEMKLRGIHSHMILTNINSFLTQHFTNKGWEMKLHHAKYYRIYHKTMESLHRKICFARKKNQAKNKSYQLLFQLLEHNNIIN